MQLAVASLAVVAGVAEQHAERDTIPTVDQPTSMEVAERWAHNLWYCSAVAEWPNWPEHYFAPDELLEPELQGVVSAPPCLDVLSVCLSISLDAVADALSTSCLLTSLSTPVQTVRVCVFFVFFPR